MDGEMIRKVREAAGMLQPEFADLLGVHSVTLSRFERGRDKINRTIELAVYELASELGVRDQLPPRKLVARKKRK